VGIGDRFLYPLVVLTNSYRRVRPRRLRSHCGQQWVINTLYLWLTRSVSPTEPYSLFGGFVHLGAGLSECCRGLEEKTALI
jgi:hypothetical protein